MTASGETWVCCGDIDLRGTPRKALQLRLGRGGNLSVDLDGIDEKLNGVVRPVYRDLIRLAAYVVGADCAVPRGRPTDTDLGEKWHRRFHLVVGVECLDVWRTESIRAELEGLLGFLSDDTFTFDFRHLNGTPAEKRGQLPLRALDGRPLVRWDHIDELMLFSGGLDSLAGAVDAAVTRRKNVMLVSHNSGTKTWHTQQLLAERLRKTLRAAGGRAGPEHVAIRMEKHLPELRREQTQRTRSFLFAAFAGAVADLAKIDRILFFENGVMALHVPKTPQLVGARGTRTAHPKVLAGMQRLLSALGDRPVRVENPFVLKTRTEVLADLAATPLASSIADAVSCATVARRPSLAQHCGVCSQCVDRRISVLAAGACQHDPEHGYGTRLERDPISAADRLQLLAYVDSAYRFKDCPTPAEFLIRFGDVSRSIPELAASLNTSHEDASTAIFELHRRHGAAVAEALSGILGRATQSLYEGTLPADTLPCLLANPSAPRQDIPPTFANTLRRNANGWSAQFRDGQPFVLPDSPGMSYLAALLSEPGHVFVPTALLARHHGDQVPGDDGLLEGMDISTRNSLRAEVDSLLQQLSLAHECDDLSEITRISADLSILQPILRQASSRKLRNRASDDQLQVRNGVAAELKLALRLISERSRAAGRAISDDLRVGYLAWYRSSGLSWTVLDEREPSHSRPGTTAPSEPVLVLDLVEDVGRLFGRELPRTGPNAVQRMQFFALAALAMHPNRVLTAELWGSEMVSIGYRLRDGQCPDRHLVGKLRRTLNAALEGTGRSADSLIENVPSRGYRLRLDPSSVSVVGAASAGSVPAGRASHAAFTTLR